MAGVQEAPPTRVAKEKFLGSSWVPRKHKAETTQIFFGSHIEIYYMYVCAAWVQAMLCCRRRGHLLLIRGKPCSLLPLRAALGSEILPAPSHRPLGEEL